jgi:hypothetical protein
LFTIFAIRNTTSQEATGSTHNDSLCLSTPQSLMTMVSLSLSTLTNWQSSASHILPAPALLMLTLPQVSPRGHSYDIPFDSMSSPQYFIMFDNGTTHSIKALEMTLLIPKPPPPNSDTTHLLPPFLQVGSKITFKHNGQCYKGFLSQTVDGIYKFSYKPHINKKSEDWDINIPNLPTTAWQDLCTKGISLPGHQSSSLQRLSLPASTSANFVNALALKCECPQSLLTSLNSTHLNQEIQLNSFREEKSGIQSLNTYLKITLPEY